MTDGVQPKVENAENVATSVQAAIDYARLRGNRIEIVNGKVYEVTRRLLFQLDGENDKKTK